MYLINQVGNTHQIKIIVFIYHFIEFFWHTFNGFCYEFFEYYLWFIMNVFSILIIFWYCFSLRWGLSFASSWKNVTVLYYVFLNIARDMCSSLLLFLCFFILFYLPQLAQLVCFIALKFIRVLAYFKCKLSKSKHKTTGDW